MIKSRFLSVVTVLAGVFLASGCSVTSEDDADPVGDVSQANSFEYCQAHPNPPAWFYPSLAEATSMMPNIPDWWGKRGSDQAIAMAKIACQESSFGIHASNGGTYIGMYQINKGYFPIDDCTYQCYWTGCEKHGDRHPAQVWQIVAALRYIQGRYGTPAAAWQHKLSYGWY